MLSSCNNINEVYQKKAFQASRFATSRTGSRGRAAQVILVVEPKLALDKKTSFLICWVGVFYRSIFDLACDFMKDEAFNQQDTVMRRYLKPDLVIIYRRYGVESLLQKFGRRSLASRRYWPAANSKICLRSIEELNCPSKSSKLLNSSWRISSRDSAWPCPTEDARIELKRINPKF